MEQRHYVSTASSPIRPALSLHSCPSTCFLLSRSLMSWKREGAARAAAAAAARGQRIAQRGTTGLERCPCLLSRKQRALTDSYAAQMLSRTDTQLQWLIVDAAVITPVQRCLNARADSCFFFRASETGGLRRIPANSLQFDNLHHCLRWCDGAWLKRCDYDDEGWTFSFFLLLFAITFDERVLQWSNTPAADQNHQRQA